MTVLAGIDEAGYGPRLGPLVTSATAFRLPEAAGSAGASPHGAVLWELLSDAVSGAGRRAGKRLRVCDSKVVYSAGRGLGELERTVLAFAAAADGPAATPEVLFSRLLSEACRGSVQELPWYAPRGEELPLEADPDLLARSAQQLAACCRAAGVTPVALRSRLLGEHEFNRRIGRCDNKATVLLELVTELLRELRRAAGSEALSIEVDRLGGRTDYRPFLAGTFPGAFVWEEERSVERQRYRLDGLAGPTRVEFRAKADGSSFAVALASMVSKYLREVLMRRFNAHWRALVPELPVTSGYHADANVFLAALAPHGGRLGVGEADLVRCR